MAGISSIAALSNAYSEIANKPQIGSENKDFSKALMDALDKYKELDNKSDVSTLDLLTGNVEDSSSVMIASEKAEIALNLTVAIRNKAIDAYKEIMNMQV